MKALSIRQPWAYFVVTGHKDVENRTWQTRYRGPLLIHAGLTFDKEGAAWLARKFSFVADKNHYALGAIVGRVDLVDCVDHSASDWFFGPYGFVFENAIMFPRPIPCRGQLGIFEVDADDIGNRLDEAINIL